MTNEAMDRLFSLVRRACEVLQDDLQHQVAARPTRRPPALNSLDWSQRSIGVQLTDARRSLDAFAAGDESGLPLACLFLAAALVLRDEQRKRHR